MKKRSKEINVGQVSQLFMSLWHSELKPGEVISADACLRAFRMVIILLFNDAFL